MLGAKRKLVVAALLGLGLLLIYRASALLPLFVGLLLGWGLIALHACLKVTRHFAVCCIPSACTHELDAPEVLPVAVQQHACLR